MSPSYGVGVKRSSFTRFTRRARLFTVFETTTVHLVQHHGRDGAVHCVDRQAQGSDARAFATTTAAVQTSSIQAREREGEREAWMHTEYPPRRALQRKSPHLPHLPLFFRRRTVRGPTTNDISPSHLMLQER